MCWLQHAALLRHYPQFVLAILAVLGLAECFAGFSAWGFLRGISGVLMGAFVGIMICMILLHNPFLAVAGLLVGAIGGAILFVTVEPLGAFFVGLSTGGSGAWIVAAAAHLPMNAVVSTAMTLAGLATAAAVVLGGKRAVIILTALAGAQQVAAIGMAFLFPEDGGPMISLPEVAIFLLLAFAGLTVQFSIHRTHDASGKSI